MVLNLTVNPSYSITLNEEICDGSSYPFNGTNLSTDGVYIAALLTEEGCDSVVTLNLAVKPTVTTTVHDTICDGGSYTFNGSTYTASGNYIANLVSVEGCDSTVTLNLVVNPTRTTTVQDTICDGSTYSFNGTTYSTTGTYIAKLVTVEGCDSTVTLELIVNPIRTTTLQDTICDGATYLFNGTSYSTSGTYASNLLTYQGCDSTVILNLVVHPVATTTTTDTICDNSSYVFNGTTYTSSGVYIANLSTVEGCDSTVTLNST